jgi:ribosome biogenesis protein MAK21
MSHSLVPYCTTASQKFDFVLHLFKKNTITYLTMAFDTIAVIPPKRRRGRNEEPKEANGQHTSLLVQLSDQETWYTYGNHQQERNALLDTKSSKQKSSNINNSNPPDLVNKYKSLADNIYRQELQLFNRKQTTGKDDRWVEGTMRKGTLKDRVAAMSVVVSTDPVHKFYSLDGLLQMTNAGGNSRVAQLAAQALEDLFVNTFLPADRKLVTLAQRPLMLYEKESKKTLSPRILLLWRFEEMVKEKYQLFLRHYVGQTLREGMEVDKIVCVRLAAALLRSVPEGEATLLQLIVNKLGDPAKKVAAAAGYELRKVLAQHPSMEIVIAREVQQLAHRPGLSSRALYNCIIFLNQLQLKRDDDDVAESKESFPVSLITTYFRLFEVAVKKKDERVNKKDSEESSGMKSRLLSALLTGVNRAHPYLPAKDQSMDEHVDSLYRVSHTTAPAACTQALLLLFHVAVGSNVETNEASHDDDEIASVATKRRERFYRALYSTLSNHDLLGAGKHMTMYFNLLYKAMKYDTDQSRVVAFAKRIMCTTIHCSSAVVAASIFLLNEISKHHPALASCFVGGLTGPDAVRMLNPDKREPKYALVANGIDDPDTRDKKATSWEFALTVHHFHPSVIKFSASIGVIEFTGDPLRDFALTPFLDKFAYRNPKSAERVAGKVKRGESIAERRSGTDSTIQSRTAAPVNDRSFLQKDTVDAQDEFFYKFFSERAKRDKLKGIERHKSSGGSDDEDGDDQAMEQEEGVVVGERSFEDFEQAWETDSEEEAFVDSLAQKIIEDAVQGEGPQELDDEDPDTDDWGDLDDENDIVDEAVSSGRNPQNDAADNLQEVDEDDAFMEASIDESDDDEASQLVNMDGSVSDDGDVHFGDVESMEGDHEELAFFGDSDGGSLENEGVSDDENTPKKKSVKKIVKELPLFADADEFEAIITESLSSTKQKRSRIETADEDTDENEALAVDSKKKAKRKKNKKHRKV